MCCGLETWGKLPKEASHKICNGVGQAESRCRLGFHKLSSAADVFKTGAWVIDLPLLRTEIAIPTLGDGGGLLCSSMEARLFVH